MTQNDACEACKDVDFGLRFVAGIELASHIHDDIEDFSKLLIKAGFHSEAAKMAEAMVLICNVRTSLQESVLPIKMTD